MVARTISGGSYDITIAPGSLARAADLIQHAAPAHRYAIITDTNVGPLYAESVQHQFEPDSTLVFTVPAGERHKTRESWAHLTDGMLAAGLGRDSAVIALGGGVVCDLAGFVAATFMRGIPVVHLPTTLLAMIDASVGGKTAVDTPGGKNLVGAFHPPSAVIVDPQVLGTLPPAELRSGLAEAFKHAVIADPSYFDYLAQTSPALVASAASERDLSILGHVIEESVRIKAGVVAGDEREKGERKTLNFGHTVGHAVELLSGFSMRHGEAVAAGMVLECRAGELAGITDRGIASRLSGVLAGAGLPVSRPDGPSAEQVIQAMRGDKKNRSGDIAYALPERIGTMAGALNGFAVAIPDSVMLTVLA